MTGELPAGTVTFLFTDIEGSTRLLGEFGAAAYADALTEHRQLLRDAFARHGGVEVDTQGDAFFVAFGEAEAAVRAAGDAQQALGAGPIRARMGLHTGTPHLAGGGYVGEDVHLGARICAASHGGQVLLSKQTRELVADALELTDLGEHRLKDFAAPIWLYQLGADRFPPLRTISNTNLPRPASSFVGREQEVAQVGALLRNGARLVTLTGPGGSGKTRLAIETAAELIPTQRNGVFWVALAALTDPALVTSQIAQTLGAKDSLAEHVGERQMLLLLDNFEQVVDAAPDLASLLEACPNLRLLVTSRELLRVRGEVEYAVPPLAEPDAVELFCSRAGIDADLTVAELCRHLDNLPLAVELAAARASVMSPSQILGRLAQRLDMLKGGRDADARQRTLRATIEWSHDLLTEGERALFARLAVFHGGWTLEAAEAVVGANVGVLESLVDKSLVRRVDEWFMMLETIREYAAERLVTTDERPQLRAAHALYYLALAKRIRTEIGADPAAWRQLETDNENLRAAISWVVETADRPRGLVVIRTLWHYWVARGLLAEGDHWVRRILDLPGTGEPVDEGQALIYAGEIARFSGDLERAVALKTDGLEVVRGRNDELHAATARDLALSLLAIGDIEAADTYASEALEVRLRSTKPTPGGLAHALEGRAHVEWHRGNHQQAIEMLRQALDHLIEPDYSYAETLESLADWQRRSGDMVTAKDNLTRALGIAADAGDLFTLAFCLRGAGSLLADLGQPVAAARIWGALETFVRETGLSFAEQPSDFAEQTVKVRHILGEAGYESAYSEGLGKSHADASRFALAALAGEAA